MIIEINLLPYRELLQQAKIRRFYSLMIAAALLGMLLVFIAYQAFSWHRDQQQQKNDYLQMQLNTLDIKLKNVASLREKRNSLLERKQLVESLQQRRGEQAKIFDSLLRQTPNGVYLKSMQQNQNNLELSGYALSQTLVTRYMRLLGESTTFTMPVLVSIEDVNVNSRLVKEFKMTVPISYSKEHEEGKSP
jgi:type IV pilus assembly protein PilN